VITEDDVAAYLDRLGLEAEPPSVDALFRLHRAQLEHVPYETTWIAMGQRRSVDRLASLRNIAHHGTGGYCFHLNGAMSLLLESLGYDVSLHVGGVHGPDGPGEEFMTNHLVLQAHGLPTDENPSGDWYLDSGLGDALHEPLPLIAGRYRQGPFDFELAADDSHIGNWRFFHHQHGSFTGMVWRSPTATMDEFADRNVLLSTSPESGFVKTPTVQLRDANGVDILRGQVLSRVDSAVTIGRTLETRDEWFAALADMFELPLDHATPEEKDVLWNRVHATHQAWLETAT
jgi:N-hydroxyarylamine O-acetyltransferase